MNADQFGGFDRTPMEVSEPFIPTRKARYGEMSRCCDLVRDNWGDAAAERCHEQFIEYFKGGKYAPTFFVATDDADIMIGFAAYSRTMLMKDTFDLIWIAIDKAHQAKSVGKALTKLRLDEIAEHDGQLIQLVTQKISYFGQFGFFPVHHLGNRWFLMLKKPRGEISI